MFFSRSLIGATSQATTLTGSVTAYATFGGGTSKYLSASNDTAYDLGSSDFAFSFWVYRNSTNRLFFWNKYTGGTYNQFEILSSTLINFGQSNQTDWTITPTVSVPTTTWTHCVIQRNGSSVEFYMDGTANGTGSASGSPATVNTTQEIMGNVVDSRWADADYGQFLFFKRALTSGEITELYNGGDVRDYSRLSSTITDDCELAIKCNADDDSGNDISGNGRNFTKNGGLAADGENLNWDDTV